MIKFAEIASSEFIFTGWGKLEFRFLDHGGTWTTILNELTLTPAEQFARYCDANNPYAANTLLIRSFNDPMFAQLVESPSAKARLAFVEFLKAQPTPRHRDWLTKLRTEPEKSVSAATTEALENLKAQANDPPPRSATSRLRSRHRRRNELS